MDIFQPRESLDGYSLASVLAKEPKEYDRIYNLDYESFTVHQEDETKKLIKFLGLTWEEKCLAPQDNNRSISTASSKQIRQKIYQGSSQKWKKFHPYLNGVFDTLNN